MGRLRLRPCAMNNRWAIFDYPDIHSHVPGDGRVQSVDFTVDKLPSDPSQPFTLGVHPWNADKEVDWEAFGLALSDPRIVGIGEAGLDALRGPGQQVQKEVFERQIALAEKFGLPLVIHSVRSNHLILQLKKLHNPSVPWIIHGFRGKAEEARRLMENGIHLSLGHRHDEDVATLPFPELLHRESDEEPDTQ